MKFQVREYSSIKKPCVLGRVRNTKLCIMEINFSKELWITLSLSPVIPNPGRDFIPKVEGSERPKPVSAANLLQLITIRALENQNKWFVYTCCFFYNSAACFKSCWDPPPACPLFLWKYVRWEAENMGVNRVGCVVDISVLLCGWTCYALSQWAAKAGSPPTTVHQPILELLPRLSQSSCLAQGSLAGDGDWLFSTAEGSSSLTSSEQVWG